MQWSLKKNWTIRGSMLWKIFKLRKKNKKWRIKMSRNKQWSSKRLIIIWIILWRKIWLMKLRKWSVLNNTETKFIEINWKHRKSKQQLYKIQVQVQFRNFNFKSLTQTVWRIHTLNTPRITGLSNQTMLRKEVIRRKKIKIDLQLQITLFKHLH